jgi:hypothetical protein
MRKALIGVVLITIATALPALAQPGEGDYTFVKKGYCFFDGDMFGAVGELEPIQPFNPPIDYDFAAYEVTWAILDLQIVAEIPLGPDVTRYEFGPGFIGLYEDASFDLDYGNSPADGIASATNGTPSLVGEFLGGSYMFDVGTELGTFLGDCVFNDGSRYDELLDLGLGYLPWYIFNGSSADPMAEVPPGYQAKFAGRIYNGVVPTESSSWSDVKSLY